MTKILQMKTGPKDPRLNVWLSRISKTNQREQVLALIRFPEYKHLYHFNPNQRTLLSHLMSLYIAYQDHNRARFDEDLVRNQDDEFNFRLAQNGGRIWLDPLIKSQYIPRSTLLKLFSQYFQYGLYKVRVLQKRKGIASYRQLVPPIFSLFLIFSFFILVKTEIPILILSSVYLPVNIAFSIISSKKIRSKYFIDKISSFFIFPLIFFILHISYGFGYLFGFIYFIKKWGDYKTYDSCFDLKKFKNT